MPGWGPGPEGLLSVPASTAPWLGKRTLRSVIGTRTASTGTWPGAVPVTVTGMPAAPVLK